VTSTTAGPSAAAPDPLLALVGERGTGVLVTLKRDGRPQLSNVSYAFDPATTLVRVSVTDGRAKVANLRRDPRVSLYVTRPDMGAYAVVEGIARLSPVAAAPDDEVVDQLVDQYRAAAGEHPDWAEFRAAMVADHRLLLSFSVEHRYGWGAA
jgi:PPOX class probable F420-dependent enzyme